MYDTLIDLATSADRQAARAADFDDITASSALFVLADQLRSMAHTVRETPPTTAPAVALLDRGREQVATAMLRFDAHARREAAKVNADEESR